MSCDPLVSIIIPCYNAELWLIESIESALAQTWKNTEIIVVDDGSVDKSLSIACAYTSLGVQVISQPNMGASAARNRAYGKCRGEFIQYLDADDILKPDKIERQVNLLRNGRKNCVASGEWARFCKSPNEAYFLPQPLWKDMNSVEWLVCAWEGHWMMHPAAWLVPRSVVETAGLWNEAVSLNDDGEYFARIILASEGIKFCWGAKSYYRSGNSTSLSASRSDEARKSAFQTLLSMTDSLLAIENTPRTRYACATVFQRFIYESYPDVPELRAKAETKVRELGGSRLEPAGGPLFEWMAAIAGWKAAKRTQKFLYRYGYRQVAIGRALAPDS